MAHMIKREEVEEPRRRSGTLAENLPFCAVQARAAIPSRSVANVVVQEALVRVEAEVAEAAEVAAPAAAALDCAEVTTAEPVCEPLALADDRPPEDFAALDDDDDDNDDETARETAVGAGSVPSKGVLAPELVEVGAGIVKRVAAVPVGTSDDGTLDGDEELALAIVIMSV